MPSVSYRRWRTVRRAALDDIEMALPVRRVDRDRKPQVVGRVAHLDYRFQCSVRLKGDAPAHLAHAAGAGDDRAGFGISNKRLLELRIFIVAQIFMHETREQLGLDKAEHALLYGIAVVRQCRMVRVRPNERS